MIGRPPRSTRTYTPFPSTTLFRPQRTTLQRDGGRRPEGPADDRPDQRGVRLRLGNRGRGRSEEHTSELQSLMRISYAVFCLKKKTINTITLNRTDNNTTQ